VLEEIVIANTEVLDVKDEAEVAKRLRVRSRVGRRSLVPPPQPP
jgi:hypothetical protein